jgi:hypothetical protein
METDLAFFLSSHLCAQNRTQNEFLHFFRDEALIFDTGIILSNSIYSAGAGRNNHAIPILSCVLLVLVAFIVETAWPQGKGTTGLHVRVQPEAKMRVEAVGSALDNPGHTTHWFRVDLAVRVHSGATASLFVEQVPTAAGSQKQQVPDLKYFLKLPGSASPKRLEIIDSSRPVFTVQQNGRFSLLVGIGLDNAISSAESLRLVLRSSDGALYATATLPPTGVR